MSINAWLAISVTGYDLAREAAVRAAIASLLTDEQLVDDFSSIQGRPTIWALQLVEGGGMLRSGCGRPVVLSGSVERFTARIVSQLGERVSLANGGPCDCAFLAEDADDPELARVTRIVHAVENLLVEDVEGMRGDTLLPLLDVLTDRYFELLAWEQRDEMIHLLCDQPDERMTRIYQDILRAPPSMEATPRHFAHVSALAGLHGGQAKAHDFARDPARTARLVAGVQAGKSVAEALQEELG